MSHHQQYEPTRESEPETIIVDLPTIMRDVEASHFEAGDAVLVILGSQDGNLTGRSFQVVAPSWHQATDADGWRLRDATGGEDSYCVAAPHYLVHIGQNCPPCVEYIRDLERELLPELPPFGSGETHAYRVIDGELVHIADAITVRWAW